MKKIVMMLIAVLATVIIAGCSKTSKFEGICREVAALSEKSGGRKISETEIKEKVEEFKKLSSDEQDKKLEEAKSLLEMAKAASEMKKKIK